jgi:hypothetical protein
MVNDFVGVIDSAQRFCAHCFSIQPVAAQVVVALSAQASHGNTQHTTLRFGLSKKSSMWYQLLPAQSDASWACARAQDESHLSHARHQAVHPCRVQIPMLIPSYPARLNMLHLLLRSEMQVVCRVLWVFFDASDRQHQAGLLAAPTVCSMQ